MNEIRVDESMQYRIGRDPEEARDSFAFTIPLNLRVGERSVDEKP